MLKESDFHPGIIEKAMKKTEKYSKLTIKARIRGGYQDKTTGWLQGRLSLSSLRGRSNECQEFLGT